MTAPGSFLSPGLPGENIDAAAVAVDPGTRVSVGIAGVHLVFRSLKFCGRGRAERLIRLVIDNDPVRGLFAHCRDLSFPGMRGRGLSVRKGTISDSLAELCLALLGQCLPLADHGLSVHLAVGTGKLTRQSELAGMRGKEVHHALETLSHFLSFRDFFPRGVDQSCASTRSAISPNVEPPSFRSARPGLLPSTRTTGSSENRLRPAHSRTPIGSS